MQTFQIFISSASQLPFLKCFNFQQNFHQPALRNQQPQIMCYYSIKDLFQCFYTLGWTRGRNHCKTLLQQHPKVLFRSNSENTGRPVEQKLKVVVVAAAVVLNRNITLSQLYMWRH